MKKMKKNKNNKKVVIGVYWDDVRVYYDDGIYDSTFAYTEGILTEENKEYLLIKNPETVIVDDTKTRNHPEKKPKFYYIPKSLITKIVFYEKEN